MHISEGILSLPILGSGALLSLRLLLTGLGGILLGWQVLPALLVSLFLRAVASVGRGEEVSGLRSSFDNGT